MSSTSEALARSILSQVGDRFTAAGGVLSDEIRPRIEDLTFRITDLSLRKAAGEDVDDQIEVVNASLANLASASTAVAARAVRDGIRDSIMGGIRLVFSLLDL
jgi:hypothetical protein